MEARNSPGPPAEVPRALMVGRTPVDLQCGGRVLVSMSSQPALKLPALIRHHNAPFLTGPRQISEPRVSAIERITSPSTFTRHRVDLDPLKRNQRRRSTSPPPKQLGDDVRRATFVTSVEDRNDVRVRAEASHRLRLARHALAPDVVEAVGLNEREGDIAVEPLVMREI